MPSVEACPPAPARRASDGRKRSRQTNIALQRASQKSLKQNRTEKDFFSTWLDPAKSVQPRFSPATDVLPFYSLPLHQTKFASRTFKIITGAAVRLHRE
jgi:hypothetical protein